MRFSRCVIYPVILIFISALGACSQSDQYTPPSNTDNLNSSPVEDSVLGEESLPIEQDDTQTPVLTATLAALPDIVGETSRHSIDSNEAEANGNSINGSISADGRYVVFDSVATNLTTDDSNSTWDIFLRDRLNESTVRLTVSPTGAESDGASIDPVISDDGTTIVFSSSATNLVDEDTNQVADVFRYNIITSELVRISINQDNVEGNNDSDAPDVSEDGRFIVYESNATNLSSDNDTNEATDVFLYDSQTGETERISVNSENEQGNGISRNPSVSDDGRFVVFDSESSNLVENDNNEATDIFLRDRLLGETYRINVNNNNDETNDDSVTPVISGNGSVVAYRSIASNLVDNDNNNVRDIFVRDLDSNTTTRISVSSTGIEGNATTFASPSIDASGRYIVFYSAASNLVDNDINNAWDVFLHDRELRQTTLASVSSNGEQGNASSFVPVISAGGHYVVFGSGASNLVAEDNNDAWDIFTRVALQPNRAPIADAGDDTEIYLSESLTLDGSNSSDPDDQNQQLSYSWNIESAPQGSVAEIARATDVFALFTPDLTGEYIISLTVNDGEVDSVADEILVTVVDNLSPQAVINASVESGDAPLTVTFSGTNSSDPEGAQLIYNWNFADPDSMDNASNEESDTHIFTRPGQYTVTLTVTDDFGQTDQASVVINALAANVPPTVQLTASPSSGSAPLIVNFMANATDDDGDTLSYLWDFGDGSSSTETNPMHEFTQEGIFEVTLTVSDNSFEVQNTVQITVAPSFELKTKSARLEINHVKEFRDKIHIKARFDSSAINLSLDDVIRISINQTVLLEQPLSSFVQKDDEGMLKYKEKHLYAKLNPAKGYIKLSRHKMNLADLDASELVNIELALGSQVSNEAIQFVHVGHEKCQKNSHDKHDSKKHVKHQGNEPVNKDIYIYRAHHEKHSHGDHDKHGANKHEKSGDEESPD